MKKTVIFLLMLCVQISYASKLGDIIDKTIRFDKWEEAKRELESYIKTNPADAYAFSVYASVLNQLKDYDNAIIAARNSINYEQDPSKKSERHFDLGTYYYNKGLKDMALSSYAKSLEINPKLAANYYMAGLIHYQNKDYEKAVSNWQKYIEYSSDEPKREKMREALSKFEKYLVDEKTRIEEEKKQRDDFLKGLLKELAESDKQSISLEADKKKDVITDEDLEEIE